jgi:hypothetical protein
MKKPADIPKLLAERSKLIARVAVIDAALFAAGVRPVEKVVGRGREVALDVIALISQGVGTTSEIAARTGRSYGAVAQMLHLLARSGEICRVSRGVYKVGAA